MRRSIPILCCHAIDASDHADGTSGHPRKLFAQHLETIRRLGFITISASDLLDICAGVRPLDRRYLLLTFDDGHLSHWLHAAPPGSAVAGAIEREGVPLIPWDQSRQLLRSARFVASLTRAREIDIVHAFHSRPVKAAVLARLIGGAFAVYVNRGVTYRPNPLTALFALAGDGVVCNSHAAMRVLTAHLVPAARINVVYNSVAADGTGREEGDQRGPVRRPEEPIRVVWVGNANPVKGPDVLCQVAASYASRYPEPAVSFLAFGVRPTDVPAARHAGQPQVQAMGQVEPEAVRRAMAGADIFLLTSRRESLPNVLLEALSARTTRSSGARRASRGSHARMAASACGATSSSCSAREDE